MPLKLIGQSVSKISQVIFLPQENYLTYRPANQDRESIQNSTTPLSRESEKVCCKKIPGSTSNVKAQDHTPINKSVKLLLSNLSSEKRGLGDVVKLLSYFEEGNKKSPIFDFFGIKCPLIRLMDMKVNNI